MTIAEKTASLTKVINETVKELEVTESSLDSQVTTAQGYETTAATHVTTAEGYRNQSLGHGSSISGRLRTASQTASYSLLPEVAVSDTANNLVDVFVYDTTKDSDGGAWRDRTQHTSWYNETLNTSTRGATKKFPAVAIIATTSDSIIIYDGDDPSMPMWMKVTTNDGRRWIWDIGTLSVTALNGTIVIGNEAPQTGWSGNGVYIWNFVADTGDAITQGYNPNFSPGPFALGSGILDIDATSERSRVLSSYTIYDVAMTILPDAPTDSATGLPVPTIALGTSSNPNFLRDDGTVFQVNYGSYDEDDLAFNDDWTLMMVGRHADRSFKTYIGGNEFVNEVHGGNNTQRIGSVDIKAGTGAALGNDQSSANTTNTIKWMFGQGFTRLKVNTDNFSDSMVCNTNHLYTSGWLVGDIKGAFLADTDDTNVSSGTEYAVDGGFDDATKWTATDGSTVSGGVLNVADGTINEFIYNSGATTYFPKDKQAIVTFTISNSSANFGVRVCCINPSNGNSLTSNGGTYYTSDGTYTVTTTRFSTSVDWVIGFQRIGSHTGTLQIDNVSVKLAEPDRSYKNDGLLINGTVTKTPVATGAELVSYSNFNGGNYLRQLYNSELDFGTGDFCMMVWAKDHGAYDTFLARSDNVNSSTELIWQTGNTADSYRLFIGGQTIQALGLGFPTEGWHLHTVVRRSGSIYLYHDGEQVYTTSSVGGNSVTQSGAVLTVGIANDVAVVIGADAFEGEMALLRISGTAPTEAQLKKIYEDERHLFKENTNCTIYGTGHLVKALAYDEDTELLHVGTNDGRSSFSGLVRVDEKADATTIAISAANGLIVED